MGETLTAHRSGSVTYYGAMITSGPMEGTTNKIKTRKPQAYGFRDQEFFKLKIPAIREAKYALIGKSQHGISFHVWVGGKMTHASRG